MTQPILYSFRRCPYAMRARMAIAASGVVVELREVLLRNKPKQLVDASPKATVPVLVLDDKTVIDESLDIMKWALTQNDPDNWLMPLATQQEIQTLIEENDSRFKQHLDHYKYADRFPAWPVEHYREQGEVFLRKLDKRLQQSAYLLGESVSIADIAIFPFIRQFALVDKGWFEASEYLHLRQWLASLLLSPCFIKAMEKTDVWQLDASIVLFANNKA